MRSTPAPPTAKARLRTTRTSPRKARKHPRTNGKYPGPIFDFTPIRYAVEPQAKTTPNVTKIRPANQSFWFFTEMRIGPPLGGSICGDLSLLHQRSPPVRPRFEIRVEVLRGLAGRHQGPSPGEPLLYVLERHHFLHRRVEPRHDRRGRSLRHEDALPRGGHHARISCFRHRRNVGEGGDATSESDPEGLEPPRLDELDCGGKRGEHHLRLAADQIGDRGTCAAFVGDVQEIDPGQLHEHLRLEPVLAAGAGRSEIDLALASLRVVHELLHVRYWDLASDDQHVGDVHDPGARDEVDLRVHFERTREDARID